ncbi:MAG: glycine cleavage T C-terminal barrel domain-containing protein [Pseudomonadota bacterium]
MLCPSPTGDRHITAPIPADGIPITLMRAGWSKQRGFELFLRDGTKGDHLWQIIKEAGTPYGIGPGYPNPSERIESGLLNYGTDTDDRTNPFEVRMEKFVDLNVSNDVIGVRALRQIKTEGVKRHQLGIVLHRDEETEDQSIWLDIVKDGAVIGHMTNKAWSYRLKRMIGYALVSVGAPSGDAVQVMEDSGGAPGRPTDLPFRI